MVAECRDVPAAGRMIDMADVDWYLVFATFAILELALVILWLVVDRSLRRITRTFSKQADGSGPRCCGPAGRDPAGNREERPGSRDAPRGAPCRTSAQFEKTYRHRTEP
jgi:hypothetical protein